MKKLFVILVAGAFIAVACIPIWTTKMADMAFEKPNEKMSPEAVKRAIRTKMFIFLFEDAKKTAEKAIIYFPESQEMPFFIYNAAMCSEKCNNNEAAIYWYTKFVEKYPKHQWAQQAARTLDRLRNMK